MTGEQLSALKVNTGYMNYRVKVSQKSYLEDDPNFECKSYGKQDSYGMCLQKEISEQIRPFMKCSPPWLDDDENKWCNNSLDLEDGDVESYRFFLGNILNYRSDIHQCFQPCKSLYFDVKLDIFDDRENADIFGIYIQFEDTVETTKVNVAITTATLLTRIGGIIGVGKELLWVIIFSCGGLRTILSFCSGFGASVCCPLKINL